MTRERSRRIVVTSAAGLVQRVAQLSASLFIIPIVLHNLGIAGFGVWGAATSLVWLTGMLDLGIASALVTLIPRALAAGNAKDARAYVAAALFIGTAMSVALLAAGFAAVAVLGMRSQYLPFIIAGIALAFNIPLSVSASIWFGLQKGYMVALWEIFISFLGLVLILLGAIFGLGVIGLVAAGYCAMLVGNAGSLVQLLLRHEQLRPQSLPNWSSLRQVLGRGGLLFGISVAASAAYAFDNTLALVWLGPAASAQMAIALRLCTTGSGMLAIISAPFWPAFAEAAAVADRRWMWRNLRRGEIVVAILAVLGSSIIIMFGGPVMRWWLHQNLELGQPLLWIIAAWITITTLTLMPGFLLNSVLRLRSQFLILSFVALLGLAVKYFVAKSFGVVGILAVSPTLVLFVVWPVYLLLVRSWFAESSRPIVPGGAE